MEFELKTIFGLSAAVVALFNYLPYLIGVIKRTLQPHAFSWIIFTIITTTVALAQLSDGAGPGAWATGATAITTFLIAGFALRNGGYKITRFDTISLFAASLAIPVWIISHDPLLAVIILTGIEALGFMPTYCKVWQRPFDESQLAFSLTIVKYMLALGAMEMYTLTTVLFPAALILLSLLLIAEISWRKKRLGFSHTQQTYVNDNASMQ
jgi:hypothetical protein